ncbi:MAG: PHP domain-containing protein [Desulfobacterota bacterium]|nr:PHP domain-containing protein [Thermodesulfobacteriota bacterium]
MLKADLHIHTCEDASDGFIAYDAYTLIDKAAELGFDVISITNHDCITFSDHLCRYAQERGILLIPGIEMKVQGKHILMYAPWKKIYRFHNTMSRLINQKDHDTLFIAPHPFFPSGKSLGKALVQWHALFDAIEFCHFYTQRIDYNRKAVQLAQKFNLPLVGTSDCHVLQQLNTTYTLINADKDIESIFDAIKQGNLVVVSSPLTLIDIGRIMYGMFLHYPVKRIGHACISLMTVFGRGAL